MQDQSVNSGLPGMDQVLDGIRWGDNVVWQCTNLKEFEKVAAPFMEQAISEHKKIIYIRFAKHKPILEPKEGIQIHVLDLTAGFEAFTLKIYRIIQASGQAMYIFDCLSELQEVWLSDLMMSDFFKIICPYLAKLKTVAYFPIIRGRHSYKSIERIKETTQLFINLYHNEGDFYLHPVKVWERQGDNMFLPHFFVEETGEFTPVRDEVLIQKLYAGVKAETILEGRNLDVWDRYFAKLKRKSEENKLEISDCKSICNRMMTRDVSLEKMILEHFTPQNYFSIYDRVIGSGLIGGKACGMLLGRELLHQYMPQWSHRIEEHDSYFVGADVFYTYMVVNDLWQFRLQHRTEKDKFENADAFKRGLRQGKFPEYIREQFRKMLDYFDQSPIAVRSSSFLEDGFGNAFSGKYETVFCLNRGNLEERLEAFEEAVRTVYASTMDPSAMEYRRKRKLLDQDEQMALLVQKVSGSEYDGFFMPVAAGVGFSYNPYKWMENMDPKAGMLRLVMGMGTRAVDRTPGDYPRLVGLDRAQANLWSTTADRHKYSQRSVDVLDLQTNHLMSRPLSTIIERMPAWQQKMVLSHDSDAEFILRQRGDYRNVYFADCQGLVDNEEFLQMMKTMLAMLEEKYGRPVDIEFAVNSSAKGEFKVNLLQCRPLQKSISEDVKITDYKPSEVLFDICRTSMRRSKEEKLDLIVLVDPQNYYDFPYARKCEVAQIIGEINRRFEDKKMMLLVPGRIGTSSPELGVPVIYADISGFSAVCEVAYSAAGYRPELSYGSHMFQDLVEADVYYGAINENSKTKLYQPQVLYKCRECFKSLWTDKEEFADIIKIYDVSEWDARLTLLMEKGEAVCRIRPKA